MKQARASAQYGGKLFADTRSRVDHLLCCLESVGGSRALALAIALRYGEPLSVMNLTVDPLDYQDPLTFARDYQSHKLLSKNDFLDFGIDVEAAAYKAFAKYEGLCSQTNQKLRTRPLMGRAGRIFRLARKMVFELLTEDPVPVIDEIVDGAEWGGGASSNCHGRWTGRFNKVSGTADLTADLEPYLDALKGKSWFPVGDVRVINWNTVTTVPKSYKTERTIAVEPTINAALQRGTGKHLRSLLLRWGVNTRDQSLNQRLARSGSLTGKYSTLDLSGASDTVSQALVELLFPPRWVKWFNTLRSPFYELDGERRIYHKHSSMGNGYTFELECVIFAAIARAATALYSPGSRFSVYGDDIIVRTSVDPYVRGTLRALGFVMNAEKSFRKGPFRESCGEDYFNGTRVTPYYARKWGEPQAAYVLANYLVSGQAWAYAQPGRLWARTISAVPKSARLFGLSPASGCFHVNPWNEKYDGTHSQGAFRFRTLTFAPDKRDLFGPGALVEMAHRIDGTQPLVGLPRLSLVEVPVSDTARRSGRWELRHTSVRAYDVVLDL